MIGILPAAGKATRIHGLPKYLLPIEDTYLLVWHLRNMRAVGVNSVHIGTNADNLEFIHPRLLDAWAYIPRSYATMTQTVLGARLHIKPDDNVLFAMPDTYWTAPGVLLPLQMALWNEADVAVALFKTRPGQRNGGMCRIRGNQISEVIDKPTNGNYRFIWGALAWTPTFWEYMQPDDPHVGYALPRAIADGLDVRAVLCDGEFWDCGTPEDYFACIRSTTEKSYA